MSACRFCKAHDTAGTRLVKYAVRHYAHAVCGFKAQGVGFLANLTDWQCFSEVPYRAACEAGPEVEAELIRRCDKYQKENPQ